MKSENVTYEIVPKDESKTDPATPPKGFGVRHTQVFMLFLALAVGYMLRAQLSVSMVVMTNHYNRNNSSLIDNAHYNNSDDVTANKKLRSKWDVYRTYDWDKKTQEMIVFSFFVGYISMQVPMGYFAQIFGGKIPIMVALAVNGVLSIITPWIPLIGVHGWLLMCFSRLLGGMTQAAFYPSIHTMLGKWAPLSERNRFSTYSYSGGQFGTILIFQIAGLFAGSPSLGWPVTFWFCGILNLICFGLLAKFGSDSPHNHPTISEREKAFIVQGGCADKSTKKLKTPWKHIITCKAVWGLIATHAGNATGLNLVLTQTPTYLSYVHGVEIKKSGLYSSLPYIAMYGSGIMFGVLADYLANKKLLSILNIRRVFNSVGIAVAGIFLLAFTYVTSTAAAVSCLVISMALHSAVQSGFLVNQIDLSPNFAGPIMALGNMIAHMTSLIVPVIVSNIVKNDMTNQYRWQIVFLIIVIMQIVANTIFMIFIKTEVQPWNFIDELGNVVHKEEILIKKNEQAK